MILISSNYDCIIEDKLKFLGYDISGESYYHSPIYRAFFETFSNICSDIKMSEFKDCLNNNGLFENKNDAIEFLNYIDINYKNFFEEDQHIKPVQIFDCF